MVLTTRKISGKARVVEEALRMVFLVTNRLEKEGFDEKEKHLFYGNDSMLGNDHGDASTELRTCKIKR